MTRICATCKKELIVDKKTFELQEYECYVCESKRLKALQDGNPRKAHNKLINLIISDMEGKDK